MITTIAILVCLAYNVRVLLDRRRIRQLEAQVEERGRRSMQYRKALRMIAFFPEEDIAFRATKIRVERKLFDHANPALDLRLIAEDAITRTPETPELKNCQARTYAPARE